MGQAHTSLVNSFMQEPLLSELSWPLLFLNQSLQNLIILIFSPHTLLTGTNDSDLHKG